MSASTPLDAFLASAPSVPSAGTISLGLTVNLPDGTQLALSHTLDASQLLPALQAVAQRISASSSATPQKIQAVVSTQRACKAEISKLHKRVNQLAKTVTKELAATRKEALAAAAGLTRSTPSSSSGVEQVLSASPSSNDIAMGNVQPSGIGEVPPIGRIESCFARRNGTPRQPGLAPSASSRLRVTWGTCPAHTLDGLSAFSHVWLLFVFDQNRGGPDVVKAKVKPPRLDGAPTGLFACRTPHRPNPIGLSLVRLNRVEGDTLHLEGADLIDGTPVLDVKPYIPYADAPRPSDAVRAPYWVQQGASARLRVEVTPRARAELRSICEAAVTSAGSSSAPRAGDSPTLRFYAGRPEAAESALVQLLQADPRSVYRKHKCGGQGYKVSIDGLEAACCFEARKDLAAHEEPGAPTEIARVLSVQLETADGRACEDGDENEDESMLS